MPERYLPVLSIAGSDSSGGAGVQADIKTIAALGCYAMTAITAVTAQNTRGVASFAVVTPDLVEAQIRAVAEDIRPLAVKTGMLGSTATLLAAVDAIRRYKLQNVVVDPVMVATSGDMLLRGDDVVATIRRELLPTATLLTPNVHEAAIIADSQNIDRQLSELHSMGCPNILLKGGDRPGNTKIDILSLDWGRRRFELSSPAVDTPNTHGTGCTLSAAIAAMLARGENLEQAVAAAKRYVGDALRAGAVVATGSGHGPVNHFFNPHPQIITTE